MGKLSTWHEKKTCAEDTEQCFQAGTEILRQEISQKTRVARKIAEGGLGHFGKVQ